MYRSACQKCSCYLTMLYSLLGKKVPNACAKVNRHLSLQSDQGPNCHEKSSGYTSGINGISKNNRSCLVFTLRSWRQLVFFFYRDGCCNFCSHAGQSHDRQNKHKMECAIPFPSGKYKCKMSLQLPQAKTLPNAALQSQLDNW